MMHFDEMTALLYLEGQLDAAHAQNVGRHAETCAECRELLRVLQNESVWLREAIAQDEETVPARVLEMPSGGRLPWGWIATLGFSAAGAYTLWSAIIQPWRAQAAQAGFTQGSLLTMLFFTSAFWKGWDAMRSLMESSAAVILVMVLMWLLRHRLRRATIGLVVASAVLGALAMPQAAMAADTEHGNPDYVLAAGKVVKTDLIVAADSTRIDGEVDGDLIVFSSYVTVEGHVKGDVIAFGQEVRVNGTVDGNVRAWCQRLSIMGTVARNVMSWSETDDIVETGSVGGTLTAAGDKLDIDGKIAGDVLAFGNAFNLNGSLGHDLTYKGVNLTIGSGAEIKGKTKYTGRNQATVSPDAKMGSQIEFTQRKRGPNYTEARYYWHRVLLWGASLLFGIVLLWLMPGFFFDATSACNRFGLSTGLGVLFLIATPIAAVLVCVTIVGIGLGIATALVYVISLYAAQTFVGCWLGEKLLGPSNGVPAAIGRMALGLLILRVAGMMPYWIGAMVTAVVLVCGLGAIVLAIHRNMRRGTTVTAMAPAA